MNTKKQPSLILLKRRYFSLLIVFIFVYFLSSCASKKDINYFQERDNLALTDTIYNYEPKIQFGDILNINVSSSEPEAAIPFNLFETQNNGVPRPLPYIVNAKGYINFPSLGEFEIAGLSMREATEKLKRELLPFLKDAIINIRYINFKVSVLGEVRSPGSYPIDNERINILEALALAGDLTIYGDRKTVTLIREQNGIRTFTNIDLTDNALFNSPYYFLTQNDIIYVEANKTRVNSSKIGPNSYILVSSISILISLVAILLR